MKKVLLWMMVVALPAVGQGAATSKKTAPAKPEQKSAGAATNENLPSKQTVEDFLHHTFGYDQNLKYEVVSIKPAPDPSMAEVTVIMNTPQGQQLLPLFITPDHKFAISGEFVPFGDDPYAHARQVLSEKAHGPARGPSNPAVTIVEFGDLQCPACKRAQPIMDRLMTDFPNAKLIFQQFPLPQHRWAMLAAKYALCVARQNNGAFWKFLDEVYTNQDSMQQMTEEQVTPKLEEYATGAGVNAKEVAQCTTDPKIAEQIFASEELGKEMGITGTPTVFIGGRKISNVSGLPYDTLKAIVQFQADGGK